MYGRYGHDVRAENGGAERRDIVGTSDEALISTDILRDRRASIIDCTLTQVVDGDLVKVMSWCDNEWGYAAQLVREAKAIAGPAGGGPPADGHHSGHDRVAVVESPPASR